MQNSMTARRVLAGVCALSTMVGGLVISAPLFAANANKAANAAIKAATKYHGKIVSIDTTKDTITIQEKKQPPMTFNVTSTTKIRLDKAKSTLDALTPGLHASIASSDKVTALQISAHDKNAPASPAPDPAATPAPTPGT